METFCYSFKPTKEKFIDDFIVSLPQPTGQSNRELIFVEAYLSISSPAARGFLYQKILDPFMCTMIVNLTSQTTINVNLNVFQKCYDLANVNSINLIFGLST